MGIPLIEELVSNGDEIYVTSRKERITSKTSVHYIVGNAYDIPFLKETLKTRYDAIVDFMHYTPNALNERLDLLLSSADHYFFLSSCRVFMPSENAITEQSPRLLDNIEDSSYLKTEEYALAKARCEDIFKSSNYKNWTIIRPYITYGPERLQLSMLEKEGWLFRALNNRSIVFSKDLAQTRTTLTYGDDVSKVIAFLIRKKLCLGDCLNVVGNETMTWGEILDFYLDIIELNSGKRPSVHWLNNAVELSRIIGNTYKFKYDRKYDRVFDNAKMMRLPEFSINFTPMTIGIEQSLMSFLKGPRRFSYYNVILEAWMDKQADEFSSLSSILGIKNKFKYLLIRNTFIFEKRLPKGDVNW